MKSDHVLGDQVQRLALLPELTPARLHAPGALALLEAAYDAALRTIDPALAELLRQRVAEQLGAPEALGFGNRVSTSARTGRERVCFEFADQFVVYVPGITEAQRDAVAGELGQPQVLDLARMLYAFDMAARLRLSLSRLYGSDDPGGEQSPAQAPLQGLELREAIDGLHAAGMLLPALDPVTTEYVRLHCARYHHCRICQSLRLASAKDAGLEEEMLMQVARHDESRLSDRQTTALRLAEAFVTHPAGIDGELRERVLAELSPAEVVEVMFDIMAWSQQKVLVALVLDDPINPDALSSLAFDAEGHAIVIPA